MANEYYGWKIQKLTDKNSKTYIFHRALILIMSTGKLVSNSLLAARARWTGTILCPPLTADQGRHFVSWLAITSYKWFFFVSIISKNSHRGLWRYKNEWPETDPLEEIWAASELKFLEGLPSSERTKNISSSTTISPPLTTDLGIVLRDFKKN